MTVLNIFRAIGDLFTDVLFQPLHMLRGIESWWTSNLINMGFIVVGFILFFYWMGESLKFKKEGTEDLPK